MNKENNVNNTKFPVIFREQTTEDWYAEHFPEYKIIQTENSFQIIPPVQKENIN